MNEGWTEDRVKILRSMWRDGISAQLIAGALGGISRSAVIGKVHRLKLEGRRTNVVMRPFRSKDFGRRFKTIQPKPKMKPLPFPAELQQPAWEPLRGTQPIGLLELSEATCKWPLGEKPFTYCGCEPDAGSPYCAAHRAVARGGVQ